MPAVTLPFFHDEALRARYLTDLQSAFEGERISAAELQLLTFGHVLTDHLRADTPLIDGAERDATLACALLLSLTAPQHEAVYLWTPLQGLKAFNNRELLHAHLRTLQGAPMADFELKALEGEVFHALMMGYVEERAHQLSATATWLGELPSLDSQLQAHLSRRLPATFADGPRQPQQYWAQVVDTASATTQYLLNLAQRVRQVYARQSLPAHCTLQWLDPLGAVMLPPDRVRLEALIDQAASAVPSDFIEALTLAWKKQRNALAQAFAAAFYQALLQAHENASLEPDDWALLATAADEGRIKLLSLAETVDNPVQFKVAGTLLITLEPHTHMFIYNALRGLQRVGANESIDAYINLSGPGPSGLSTEALTTLNAKHTPVAAITRSSKATWLDCVDDIAQWQRRNLATALKKAQPHDIARIMVSVDQALDLRRMIDPRQLSLDPANRWRVRPLRGQTALEAVAGNLDPRAEALKHLHRQVNRFRALHDSEPGVGDWLGELINPYLAVVNGQLTCENVFFSQAATQGKVAMQLNLGDAVLESLGRPRTLPRPAPVDAYGEPLQALPQALANALLSLASARWPTYFKAAARRSNGRPVQGLWQWPQETFADIRQRLLRLELAAQRRQPGPASHLLDLLQQLLDYPLHQQRVALKGKAAVAHTLTVTFPGSEPHAALSNCLVVHETGAASGPVLLWSAIGELRSFDCLAALKEWVSIRLRAPSESALWPSLLHPRQKDALYAALRDTAAAPITLSTQLITLPVWLHLQNEAFTQRVLSSEIAARMATDTAASGQLWHRYVDWQQQGDALFPVFTRLQVMLESQFLEGVLPAWISGATVRELHTYADLMERCGRVAGDDHDYLFGIETLPEFSHRLLSAALKKDLGQAAPNPDNVMVQFTHLISAPASPGMPIVMTAAATVVNNGTLTQSAPDQFAHHTGEVVSLHMADASATVPEKLTVPYVRTLFAKLDIARQYRTLLAEKLATGDPDYPARQTLFCQVLQAALQQTAYALRLQKKLSAAAQEYVQRMLSMPDPAARASADGEPLVLFPLRLRREPGVPADKVTGMHVIAPRDADKGPVVLYIVNTAQQDLCEYPNRDALLSDILASPVLQGTVLERLAPAARRVYANGGFQHPNLYKPWLGSDGLAIAPVADPVTLDTTPINSNALQHLFRDNLEMLHLVIHAATVTTAEAGLTAHRYLRTQLVDQVLMAVPHTAALLINAWESRNWFVASYASAAQHQWGQAVAQFAAALSLLASARQGNEPEEQAPLRSDDEPEERPLPLAAEDRSAPSNRLTPFEVRDLTLSRLERDTTQHVFHHGDRYYAIIQGRAYRVKKVDDTWHVYNGQEFGPPIAWDATDNQWKPGVRLGLFGGMPVRIGKLAGPFTDGEVNQFVNRVFTVNARGMSDIYLKDLEKAQRIEAAHRRAVNYLRVARLNLKGEATTGRRPPYVDKLLNTTFDVPTPPEPLRQQVMERLEQVLTFLLDPAMSPGHSERYVTGENKPGRSRVTAFSIRGDMKQQIFLSERFFDAPPDFKANLASGSTFPVTLHFQAAVLIHEVAHLACMADDFAYVGAEAPLMKALGNSTFAQQVLRSQLFEQRLAFRKKAPRRKLFKVADPDTGKLRDPSSKTDMGYDGLLQIGGAQTLADVRERFHSDDEVRASIILMNADSIAFLATRLGAERFPYEGE
ncbi:dermonecrotic toxin domain-containing protein [Pseudomonas sp.]|uniref:dermonecrotic toxin domain-containing protein n=1 Tax=Pseudomonas sp. TaxID=306 RepID=UPI003CC620CE